MCMEICGNVSYCCSRSTPCFYCSQNWFGNSPINIDEAMTNGKYGLTGQILPLGKFQSITASLILQCKVTCNRGHVFSSPKIGKCNIFFCNLWPIIYIFLVFITKIVYTVHRKAAVRKIVTHALQQSDARCFQGRPFVQS